MPVDAYEYIFSYKAAPLYVPPLACVHSRRCMGGYVYASSCAHIIDSCMGAPVLCMQLCGPQVVSMRQWIPPIYIIFFLTFYISLYCTIVICGFQWVLLCGVCSKDIDGTNCLTPTVLQWGAQPLHLLADDIEIPSRDTGSDAAGTGRSGWSTDPPAPPGRMR